MFKKLLLLFLFVNISYGETLQEVINTALQESPFLKAYQYKINSVEGQIKKAKSLKNPSVSIGFGRIYSQAGDSAFALTNFSVSQPIRMWGERDYAVSSAKFQKNAYENFYNFQKNKLISNIYKQFFNALSIKEKIKLKKEEIKTVEKLYQFVKRSYQLGETTPLDILRVEKDLSIAKIELEKLKANLTASLNTLSSLAGKTIGSVEGDLFEIKKFKDVEIENLPQILFLKKQIESINQQIKRQKALAKPQISVGLNIGEDEVEFGKYEFGFSLSSSIPVFYKNQGEIIQLSNQKGMLYAKINQLKLKFKASINSIKKQIQVLKNQLKKVDTKVIPSISKALKLAEKGYKFRTISFFEFSNIRQQYYETIFYKINLAYQIQNLYGEYIKIGGLK